MNNVYHSIVFKFFTRKLIFSKNKIPHEDFESKKQWIHDVAFVALKEFTDILEAMENEFESAIFPMCNAYL